MSWACWCGVLHGLFSVVNVREQFMCGDGFCIGCRLADAYNVLIIISQILSIWILFLVLGIHKNPNG